MMRNQTSTIRNRKSIEGFTLIEVLIAAILVGLAVAALVGANGALTMANGAGTDQSTAEFLAEQIREMTAMLSVVEPGASPPTWGPEETTLTAYDDLDDFDGRTFSPPIGANRGVLNEFSAFSQQVTVQNVSASNFDQAVADLSTAFVRVTVQVSMNGRPIVSASWVRARY
jgi:prepilin-type N-terminal cleavage/methylation domain-containing protein